MTNFPQDSTSCPLITVIMAVHNADLRALKQAVDSILNQTFQNFEFLIVDDINPPDVRQFLESLVNENKIKLITNSTNLGLTVSLIEACNQAKGSLIARQDADDISCERRLELQVAEFAKRNDLSLLGTWFDTFFEDKSKIKYRFPDSQPTLRRLFFQTNPFCHSSVMFRKDVYFKAGGYNSKYRTSQDLDLWCRLSQISSIGILEEVLVQRACHSGSISVKKKNNQFVNSINIRFQYLKNNFSVCNLFLFSVGLIKIAAATFLPMFFVKSVSQIKQHIIQKIFTLSNQVAK